MNRGLRTARESLRRTCTFAAGLLIGTALVTPALAASAIAPDDWTTLLLVGSVALLGIGLLLRTRQKRLPAIPVWPSPAEPNRYALEQDRPRVYH
jgi:hypothetical protein